MSLKIIPFIFLSFFGMIVIVMGIYLFYAVNDIEQLKVTQNSNRMKIKDLCQESLSIKNTLRTFMDGRNILLQKFEKVQSLLAKVPE